MMLAGAPLADVSLGSILQDPQTSTDYTANYAIRTELNGIDVREFVKMNTLSGQDTLGQSMTVSLTLVNPSMIPVQGNLIRIFYYSQLLFAGTIDRVTKSTGALRATYYLCECLDWSHILMRRTLRRNFTDTSISGILESILENELIGELLTVGTIDGGAQIPLLDSDNARVFDVCRTVAGAAGLTFYVGFDKSIQMRSTSVPVAPLAMSESVVEIEGTTVRSDRENYRNVQTVVVTGTPPTAGTDAITIVVERQNDDQIAARQAIEGGTGIYQAIEGITHPTSNDGTQLSIIGVGYANIRLIVNGAFRSTVTCQVRGYGFRAGQIAVINLPTFGVSGTYAIQRVNWTEQDGTRLIHQLELTSSSLQARAYESWLSIVQVGKVTVQVPNYVASNLVTFSTPGSFTWTVPPGVTQAEFTCAGPGAGGGGGIATYTSNASVCYGPWYLSGGVGGPGGRAVTRVLCTEGQVYAIAVPSGGAAGSNGVATWTTLGSIVECAAPVTPVAGSVSTVAQVKLGVDVICQGDSGLAGGAAIPAVDFGAPSAPGMNGSPGSGIGDGVTPGGGKNGGAGGLQSTVPAPGASGVVEVRF